MRDELVKRRGNQFDTIRIMKQVIQEESQNPKLKKIALQIKRKHPNNRVEQLREVFFLAFNNTDFESDPPKSQNIRRPLRLLQDGRGNCVDYSVFNGTFCKILGIPAALKMVKFAGQDYYSHIYTITRTNPPLTLDQVIGQSEDGTEQFKEADERRPQFNREKPFKKAYVLNL